MIPLARVWQFMISCDLLDKLYNLVGWHCSVHSCNFSTYLWDRNKRLFFHHIIASLWGSQGSSRAVEPWSSSTCITFTLTWWLSLFICLPLSINRQTACLYGGANHYRNNVRNNMFLSFKLVFGVECSL
jgi:hypothetical protein